MALGTIPVWVLATVLLLYWVQRFCLPVAGWARLLSEMGSAPPRAALLGEQTAREALPAALIKTPLLMAACTAHVTHSSPGLPEDTGHGSTGDIPLPSRNPGERHSGAASCEPSPCGQAACCHRQPSAQTPRHFWQLSAGSCPPWPGHSRSLDPGGGSRGLSCLPSIRTPGSQGHWLWLLLGMTHFWRGGGTLILPRHQLRQQKASCIAPAAPLGSPACPFEGSEGTWLGASCDRETAALPAGSSMPHSALGIGVMLAITMGGSKAEDSSGTAAPS